MKKILVTQASMPPYEEYIEKIKPLWDSKWVTNMGQYHHELEDALCKYLDVPHISLMVNGHMSLEMAIQACGFPEGSEIITTPYTFISTTHAIVRNGLIPVFCDIKMSDYTIDEEKIEALITEKTVAIVAVHVYGNICNVEAIQRIAYKYNLKVIYDAAHAFGELYKGKGIADYGDIATFSFHATKVYNSIEGGAVAFRDEQLYEKLYNLKNFGIRGEELVVSVGANAKLNEFCAIMGLCNLKYVDQNILQRKRKVEVYIEQLQDIEDVYIQRFHQEGVSYNYGYFPIRLKDSKTRNLVYDTLKLQNIFSRKYFYPITSDAACFKNKYKNLALDYARMAAERILVLPLYPELDEEDIIRICDIIKSAI